MGFSRTQSIVIALPVAQVWELISDPSTWLQFDDRLQHFTPAHMAGDRLQVGDTINVAPKAVVRGFIHATTAPPARIVTADEHREIAWQQDQPGGHTKQRWMLDPSDIGTRLTRHIEVVGPLAAPLGIALAEPLTGELGSIGARMMQMASPGPDVSQPLHIIAGGAGYLGSRLATRLLSAGHRVAVLTRSPKTVAPYAQIRWGEDKLDALHELLLDPAGVNIINLMGRRIGAKFSPREVEALAGSRIGPTKRLHATVAAAVADGAVVHRWIQGSAVPLWDAGSTTEFTESTTPTADLDGPNGMGQLVADWEASAPEEAILLRTGVVLGQRAQLTAGLAAMAQSRTRPVVDGYLPWIHEDDWVGIVQWLLTMEHPPQTVVAVAPQQSRLSEVIDALAPECGPRRLPIPAGILSLAMQTIGMEPGLLLGSTRAKSEVAEDLGYVFCYPTIAQAGDAVRV